MADTRKRGEGPLSRRTFLKGAGGGVVAAGLAGGLLQPASARSPQEAEPSTETQSGTLEVALDVNGRVHTVRVPPQTTLLGALRHHVSPPLTGTKEVCDQGNCGACTVLLDGRPAYACLLLAADMPGRAIRTVEGLGDVDDMSAVQAAFCKHDALMCGFCTPGFVVAATACLEKHGHPDPETVRHELSGNVCRCGTYPHIFTAVSEAANGGAADGRGDR